MTRKQRGRSAHLLPLGALAAGFGFAGSTLAQTSTPPVTATAAATAKAEESVLPVVRVRASAERQGKDDYQASETRIGKGKQEIRDIPQALTVVTEKVMDDRAQDNVKEVLRNTAGITFQAAEGGEEDIRLHGISLQSTGDIFIDGMRDPAFYDRDTFFLDRLELLRGSASLLFGRGSTGGAVNQVTKQAKLSDEKQIDLTAGSHGLLRAVGDFSVRLGESSAFRVAAMDTLADSNGAGTRIDKRGFGASYRTGIDEQDEFGVTVYSLQNDNGVNYGVRWIKPTASAPTSATGLVTSLDPDAYYGLSTDFNKGSAGYGMLQHTHRFSSNIELTTKARYAEYTRDMRATLWNFAAAASQPDGQTVSLATLSPATVLTRGQQFKKQNLQTVTLQSDLDAKFSAWGLKHQLQTGLDFAQEKKQVYAQLTQAQGGYSTTRPNTTIGTPYDGAGIDESARPFRESSRYTSNGIGGYLQDTVQLAPMWKAVAGLRYDYLKGDYHAYNAASTTTVYPQVEQAQSPWTMKVSEWSKRAAVLFQPNEQWSFHLMGATSFNTSGDAYSLSSASAALPPEQSVNIELGAKFDTADGKLSVRGGIFRNTKLHERNTDPLTSEVELSGKRHAAGLDFDVLGRITPDWEVFGTFTWMPVATIDISSATGSEGQGTRPSMTPRYSGSLWTAYQLLPNLRIGGGLNARSAQQPNRNPGFYAPRFVVGDLMLEYAVKPEELIFKLNVKNVTNKLYADQLYTSFYVPGPGRVISLTGTYKF